MPIKCNWARSIPKNAPRCQIAPPKRPSPERRSPPDNPEANAPKDATSPFAALRQKAPALNRAPAQTPKAPENSGQPGEPGNSGPLGEPAAPGKALLALARGLQLDGGPVAKALQTLLADPSPEAARALAARLPELLPDDPQSALLLEQALAETFAEALEANAPLAAANAECRAQDPAQCRLHGRHPGQGQREGKTKGHKDAYGTNDEESLIAHPEKNSERARSVMTRLLAKKGGFEPKALYRKDTGWIGIDYGTSGNPANDYKGGHGLAHILAKHPSAKDSILDTLQKGEAYKHGTSRSKLYLILGNTVAVLTKLRTGRLLVTDYGELTEREIGRFKAEGKYHARGENQKK